jgi:hypothetical protein
MNALLLRLSIFLMVLSFVPWIMIPTLPFWPMSTKARTAAVPILLILAEVIFWGGAAIGGAELVKHRRRYGIVFRRRIGPRLRKWMRTWRQTRSAKRA